MYYNKKIKIFFVAVAVCLIVGLFLKIHNGKSIPTMTKTSEIEQIVIDPGHGGMDGGATGVDGSLEKNINLKISLKLRDILRVNGFRVVMTREKDESIHDANEKTIAKQKKSDMRKRLKIMQDNPNSLTISVHQNKFEQSQYYGAQMFYSSNNPMSKTLAECLQKKFVENLQKDNKRQ
ncbi:MAG: cell wall hydrolase/autolysin, partial [Oscillospiraceae bacterium]|nr:cell wall hydrolase/autolysin [Oscillospiraceae bacterium]